MAIKALNQHHHVGYRIKKVQVRTLPLPLGEGRGEGAGQTPKPLPLPLGEGWGEGENQTPQPTNPWHQTQKEDCLTEETPVALVYNNISHAVMMATPTDLEDFALGFSLAEGILQKPGELYNLEITDHGPNGMELNLHIHGARMDALKQQHRTLAGPTGCGLCGKTSLEQTLRPLPRVTPRPLPKAEAIQQALVQLKHHQHLQGLTGAIHAAAWCTPEGRIQHLREDVGRHNALDKLIGALHHDKTDTSTGFLLMSSRASYELVAKAAQTNLGTLVAVSGATALATDQAEQTGLNLIGFARNGRQVIYHTTDTNENSQP